MRVKAYENILTEWVTDTDGQQYPVRGEKILSIKISNHSHRRIFITDVNALWSWNLYLPLQWKKIELGKLFSSDDENKEVSSGFWIEAWEVVILEKNIEEFDEEFDYQLEQRFSYNEGFHFALNYKIMILDGQGKKYYSNKIRIINPSILDKSPLQILKIISKKLKSKV